MPGRGRGAPDLAQRLCLGAHEGVRDRAPPQLRVAGRRTGLVEEVQGRLPVGPRAHPEGGVQLLAAERLGQERQRRTGGGAVGSLPHPDPEPIARERDTDGGCEPQAATAEVLARTSQAAVVERRGAGDGPRTSGQGQAGSVGRGEDPVRLVLPPPRWRLAEPDTDVTVLRTGAQTCSARRSTGEGTAPMLAGRAAPIGGRVSRVCCRGWPRLPVHSMVIAARGVIRRCLGKNAITGVWGFDAYTFGRSNTRWPWGSPWRALGRRPPRRHRSIQRPRAPRPPPQRRRAGRSSSCDPPRPTARTGSGRRRCPSPSSSTAT